MDRLEGWGYEVIEALQRGRTPVFDGLAGFLSFLGDEPFYLILIPVLYWGVDRALALRLTVLLMVSTWVNGAFKGLVDLPRPSPDRVDVLVHYDSGGVPSGHAQNALVVWGFLVSRRPVALALVAAALLVILISASRVYLGVHFPHDLVAGWLLGGLLLAAVLRWGPEMARWVDAAPLGPVLALALGIPALMLLVHRDFEALPAAATLLGAAGGAVWERRRLRFDAGGDGRRRVLRVTVGLAVALAIWAGLRMPLASFGDPGRIFRYALLGAWLTALAPWFFVRVGWAGREGGRPGGVAGSSSAGADPDSARPG